MRGKRFSIGSRATLLAICTLTLFVTSTNAQTFATLHIFEGSPTDGSYPEAPLVQATNGNLYGTTFTGGASASGTVFKITPDGTLTTLYSFCSQSSCTDGEFPDWLVQATDGDFYGTTGGGGSNGDGTVFKINASGTLTTLHSFDGTDGDSPNGLFQATDGNFYGTTYTGGASASGTVFKITPDGALTMLYSFCSQSGCADGSGPFAPLVQASNGDFYGTTAVGGFISAACAKLNGDVGCGTIFKITPSGTLTTLYSFCSQSGCTDGLSPYAGLVQATDGNFYGTTEFGGANSDGTVFKIAPRGKLTTLYTFCSESGCTDGAAPIGGLVQDTNGRFYGTTSNGGSLSCTFQGPGCGIVFSLSEDLRPFVETQPTSAKVDAAVKILGTNLTGTTRVAFHGTPAVFKVVSRSLIETTVPTGATTGEVEVTTPHGTLRSNVPFRVVDLP
jgi:uncharacterized repeat protein (TIGR03803 family)